MFHNFDANFKRTKDRSFINLNNGTLGLCPDSVLESQIHELQNFEKNTSTSLGQSWSKLWDIQKTLAQFLNARAEDLFLRPNVTLALNEILMNLPLPPHSEILSTQFEYGAVINIARHKAQKEGHSVRLAAINFLYEDCTREEAVDRLVSLLAPKTKVFLISHVFTGNGIEIPLALLGRRLREKGVYLVVDGAHAPGLFSLDVAQDFADVDFYAGNLHKWFMGPKGTAFGWVHPRHQALLKPSYGSWTTEKDVPPAMQEFARQSSPFASEFLWSHSQSFSSYFALKESFQFWGKHSANFIFSEIEKRMDHLENGLLQIGITPVKSRHSQVRSRFLCYKISEFKKLSFEGLLPSGSTVQVGLPRVDGDPIFRLTPHIHNTENELETALQVLRDRV